jgi:hypothetical protein
MARDATEATTGKAPEPSKETTSNQTTRRESYIAGEPDSAPELVRFMKCKTIADIALISPGDLVIAATQANQTVSGWEVTMTTQEEQINDLQNQIQEQQSVIDYLERNRASSTTPTPMSSKSTKKPDPDPLVDGQNPTFENWKIQMEGKFLVNHDHFRTEQAKMIYIFGRTTGDAQTHLRPRFGTNDDPFLTSREMIDFLANIYLDPFKVKNAHQDYWRLNMNFK